MTLISKFDISYYDNSKRQLITTQLFKPFKFGNGNRISDKKLAILEFKYLQNKKWKKQAVTSTRIRKSYRTYWLFSFHSDNWKKLKISLQKLATFNIYHILTPLMKLCRSRFLFIFSLCDVKNEVVFLILEYCSLRGVKQKNTRKNMKFWPLNSYYKRSDWKLD